MASSIELISYHIPKTAGTSIKNALISAYGQKRVFDVYEGTGPFELSNGNPIWFPRKSKVLHGHFQAVPQHLEQFPNAKRVVWLRDPIARSLSHLNHVLALKQPTKVYEKLWQRYLSKGITDTVELFNLSIEEPDMRHLYATYHQYLRQVDIAEFDFVGKVENIATDMARFESLVGHSMQLEHHNSSQMNTTEPLLDKVRQDAKDLLHREYAIYNSVA